MLIPGKVCSRRHGAEFCCFEGVDAVFATAGIGALLPMAESYTERPHPTDFSRAGQGRL